MHRAATIACLIVMATAAPAAAQVETREGQRRDLGLATRLSIARPGFSWQGFAQLAGGAAGHEAEGEVGAGLELRLVAAECDPLRVGGQGRLGWAGSADGARPTAEQWASVCLAIGPMVMEVGHHLEWDVRPALLAPLGLRAGANRRETASFRWQPLRRPLATLQKLMQPEVDAAWPEGDLVIFDVSTEWSWLWSAGGPVAQRETAEAIPFGYVRPRMAPWGEARDVRVDIGAAGGEFVDDGAAIHVWLARVSNLELGPVLLTAGGGIASASAGPFISDVEREVDVTTPRFVLGFEAGGEHVHGYVRATRDATLAADGYATIDMRLASGLRVDIARTRVGLDTSMATTRAYVPGAMPVAGRTGGVSLSLAQGLGAHLAATVQLDVARSFYGPQADAMGPALAPPQWGVVAYAALQATIGR